MLLALDEPDWSHVIGGDQEASWVADRNRKLGIILEFGDDVLETMELLEAEGALFTPTSETLELTTFAVDWYVSLAGYSLKTLSNIRSSTAAAGVSRRPTTIRSNLASGHRVPESDLAAFAGWLRREIDQQWPSHYRTSERALSAVSMILGGRAIGQGQNLGGSDAVVLLKSAIAAYARQSELTVRAKVDMHWHEYSEGANAVLAESLSVGSDVLVEFPIGGNVPDVRFLDRSGELLALGEVKGRKDTSNVWESWMPQVADHVRTWTSEFPDAARLFFGTLISNEMVEGTSARGTGRQGLKQLWKDEYLNGVFNLWKISLEEAGEVGSFSRLMDAIVEASS